VSSNRDVSGDQDPPLVDDLRLGARFRALRHRLGWRQADAGARAGLSQDVISLVERGHIDQVSVRALRAHARSLDAELVIAVRWRGGELDRLMDEGHAALVGAVASLLDGLGWDLGPEVSFAVFGERGSIDVVAWHAASGTLLVVEVKTELTSIEETLRRHDAKARIAAGVCAERFGWRANAVGRLLVLPEGTTPRRQVERHRPVLRAAYPLRSDALRSWLRGPSGAARGLLFLPLTSQDRTTRPSTSRRRIRRSTASVGQP
jgi:transcriptional regulator with XRE-family HTH domain